MLKRAIGGMLLAINTKENTQSTQEHNKAVVRDCYAQASAGNFDALPDLVTDDYLLHPDGIRGADGLAQMVQGHRDAILDLSVTIDHQFAEDEFVATRFTLRGHHVTDHDVAVTGLALSRISDGKIAEEWEIVDVMTLLAQIGQSPSPETSSVQS
jgi:predicted ester cyclase